MTGVMGQREGRSHLRGEGLVLRGIVIDTYADDHEALGGVFRLKAVEGGEGLLAGAAPGSPEVDEHDLARGDWKGGIWQELCELRHWLPGLGGIGGGDA